MLHVNVYEGGNDSLLKSNITIDQAIRFMKKESFKNLNDYMDFFHNEIDYTVGGSIEVLGKEYSLSDLIYKFDKEHYKTKLKEWLTDDLKRFKNNVINSEESLPEINYPWFNFIIKVIKDKKVKTNIQLEQTEFEFVKDCK